MKLIFKILLISLFLSLILMGLISCGARKSNVEKHKEETRTEIKDNSVTEKKIDTNVKTETKITVDDKNETVTEETVYEPKDPTKESFVIEKDGSKTVLNNVKKTVKKTTHKNNTVVSSNLEHTSNKKEAFKEQKAVERREVSKKEIKSKQTERTAVSWYWYLLFIIPVGIIYYFYKRYKVF